MKFYRKVLSNGLRIITIPLKDNPTVTVLVMVEAGSKYETKPTSGVSHFLEHMFFKGTDNRPRAMDISLELDSIGAQYNAFTSQEFTGYYAKAEAKHADKILDVVSDICLHSKLDQADIEKEKGVIVEEIHMYEDLPHKYVHDLFNELLYGNQPAGWNIAGTKESVRSFESKDLHTYMKNHYVAPATTIVVAGSIDREKIEHDIERLFKNMRSEKKPQKLPVIEEQKGAEIKIAEKKTDQAHLVLGVRTFDMYHPMRFTLKIIEGILSGGMSSRLFQKLREEMGVGYYVRASEDALTDHGMLTVSTGVDISRVNEVVEAVILEFKKLRDELVSPAELQKVKDHIEGSMALSLESSDSIAEFFGMQEVMHRELLEPQEVMERLRAVTAEDIKNTAELIFTNDRLNLAVVGPYKDSESLKKSVTF